jgi:hypothetical protein
MPQINNNTVNDTLFVKLSGDRVQKQKQLVLCKLKDVYTKFKETRPDITISFSKCSGLLERPKWCFLFGSYGTHITCVCTIHQNTKLIMQVIDRCSRVEEIISMCVCVCSTENENCMYDMKYYLRMNLMIQQRVQTLASDRQSNSHDCNTSV